MLQGRHFEGRPLSPVGLTAALRRSLPGLPLPVVTAVSGAIHVRVSTAPVPVATTGSVTFSSSPAAATPIPNRV